MRLPERMRITTADNDTLAMVDVTRDITSDTVIATVQFHVSVRGQEALEDLRALHATILNRCHKIAMSGRLCQRPRATMLSEGQLMSEKRWEAMDQRACLLQDRQGNIRSGAPSIPNGSRTLSPASGNASCSRKCYALDTHLTGGL